MCSKWTHVETLSIPDNYLFCDIYAKSTGKNLGYQLVEYVTDILSQADIPGRMCVVGITVPYDVW